MLRETTEKPRKLKGSAVSEDKKERKTVKYSEDEKKYMTGLQKKLTVAQTQRDQTHGDFDGLGFTSYWWAIERAANTVLKPKVNKVDTQFQSGTLRTKMLAVLSVYQGLNLKADISAYDHNEMLINRIGNGMEDILDKVGELENDEELRMLRQYEMVKHGYVFVQDIWDQRWLVEKEMTSGFYGNIQGVKWTTTRVRSKGRPRKRIIPGLAVYLGDLKQYFITNQPYIFTVEVINWVEAEQIFGNWERWDYVGDEKEKFSGTAGEEMSVNAWRFLSNIKKEQVEVVRFEDQPNNELQIILNGVPMLPAGYPLSEVSPGGVYTIVQQNLEPIRATFAYGKSFIFKNKNIVAILDEMMKLAVLKTQKSFMPSYINKSKKFISRAIFQPGKITRGINPGDLVPLSDKEVQGVTAGEFGMIQEIIKFNDRNTVSQTFTGGKEQGQVTATQIIELQRQARTMMGLLTLAATLLEKKLVIKRLGILINNWFEPTDQVVDQARNVLRNRYRRVSRSRTIEGEGPGIRMVVPVDTMPTAQGIRNTEDAMSDNVGMPIRIIALNASAMRNIQLTWMVNVNAKEKTSSEMAKLMYGQEMAQARELGLRLSLDFVEDNFAEVWERDPAKMFDRNQQNVMPGQEMQGQPQSAGAQPIKKVNIQARPGAGIGR